MEYGAPVPLFRSLAEILAGMFFGIRMDNSRLAYLELVDIGNQRRV